jgi:hypothetical protein
VKRLMAVPLETVVRAFKISESITGINAMPQNAGYGTKAKASRSRRHTSRT